MLPRAVIRAAYELACRQEIEALKPGNVHLFADGHRMSADQFLTSAAVSSGPLTDPSLPVGARIREAVRATREAVATNTNLGIILLCAPLARAAEMAGQNLRANLQAVLQAMDIDDTASVFEAIVLASPGGLGSASEHDVRAQAEVHLLEAMREASDRDMIARQYVTGFADIFERGVPVLEAALLQGKDGMWPTIHTYLGFLTTLIDSHVLRKHGDAAAAELRDEAMEVLALLDTDGDEAGRIATLKAFDQRLKRRNINPGTTADLTVACLLVHSLRARLA